MQRPEAEDANIVLIDIVHYSDLPGRSQVAAIQRLTEAVRASKILADTPRDRVFFLPTGDGMVVGFLGLPERPLQFVGEIHQWYGAERVTLKIGIHTGYAFSYVDINGNQNWAGASINLAQRVESCCEEGHILIAQPPTERLHDLEHWKKYLHGPYTFRVKRGRELRAFNFYNESECIGSSREPLGPARVFDSQFATLSQRLARHGVVPIDALRDPTMQSILGEHLAIDDAILELPIRGFAGVAASEVRVEMTKEPPLLPQAVVRARSVVAEPQPNRRKAYLSKLLPPISDQGDILTLTLGTTDHWNALALEHAIDEVHRSIASQDISLFDFPRQLNCHVLVLSADGKLMMARRGMGVRYRPGEWGATLGESIDATRDLDESGRISVGRTVEKALGKTEELGIPFEALKDASTKFIALVTEWNIVIAVLVAVVKLWTTTAVAIREYCTMMAHDQGEISALDWVDFTVGTCLPMVLASRYQPSESPASSGDAIYGTSRLAILAALCSEFGYGSVIRALDDI